jgi:AraC-like DNA-binding protein
MKSTHKAGDGVNNAYLVGYKKKNIRELLKAIDECNSLSQLFALIQHEQSHEQRDAIPERMRAARRQIDRAFGDTNFTIGHLAEQAGVSETYFRREFRECFGTSPSTYLKTIRIENARLLLSTGYYTVSEVAARCGFQSLSYFSYEFHRLTGQTPTEAMRLE